MCRKNFSLLKGGQRDTIVSFYTTRNLQVTWIQTQARANYTNILQIQNILQFFLIFLYLYKLSYFHLFSWSCFYLYIIILGALFISYCRKSFRSCNKLNAYNRRQINIRINLVSTYHVPNHYMVSNRIENRQYISVRCKEILLQK